MKFKLIEDINSLFRFNKTVGITNGLIKLWNRSIGNSKEVIFNRREQTIGLTEDSTRKFLQILTDHKFLTRRLGRGKNYSSTKSGNIVYHKPYLYTISDTLESILRDLINYIVGQTNKIDINDVETIIDAKKFIKQLYKNVKFYIRKTGEDVTHIFKLYGKRCGLFKSKVDGLMVKTPDYGVITWRTFYNLIIKK